MPEKIYLTKKGLEKIKKEYEDLKKIRLAGAEEDLNLLELKLLKLEYIAKNAELIKLPPENKQNTVGLGATVILEDASGKTKEFEILGTLEADPSEGKISSESPVGQALLNHKVSDEIVINSPTKNSYKIKKIKYQLA
jgi:transcription elongation factor GreA